MTLHDRIQALAYLGDYMSNTSGGLTQAMQLAQAHNGWFTQEHIQLALQSMANAYLSPDVLRDISQHYDVSSPSVACRVGLVLAGNIPLVGLHDVICVVLSGHHAAIKLSDRDRVLLPHLLEEVTRRYPAFTGCYTIVDRLNDARAVIATGSNNSAGYFQSYFGHMPHIIRENRSAVALIAGQESDQHLIDLGSDVFTYFGLGCRNVSHLMVPPDYTFDRLLGLWHDNYKHYSLHHKYHNNFDVQYATMMLNRVDFLMNGSVLLTESASWSSPLAVVHYSRYESLAGAVELLHRNASAIQCVVSSQMIDGIDSFSFGYAQSPAFTDYADGVDTMAFLTNL